MSVWQLGGKGLINGRFKVHLQGAPVGTFEIDSPEEALSGQVDLELPGTTFKVAVIAGGPSEGTNRVRVVGGAGGLRTVLEAQHYYQATVRMVVDAGLQAGGERLSLLSDQGALNQTIRDFMRFNESLGLLLDAVARTTGLLWRVQADGTVLLASPTWETVEPEHALLREDPAELTMLISSEDGLVQPGTTFLGKRVLAVEHFFGEGAWRSLVHYQG